MAKLRCNLCGLVDKKPSGLLTNEIKPCNNEAEFISLNALHIGCSYCDIVTIVKFREYSKKIGCNHFKVSCLKVLRFNQNHIGGDS